MKKSIALLAVASLLCLNSCAPGLYVTVLNFSEFERAGSQSANVSVFTSSSTEAQNIPWPFDEIAVVEATFPVSNQNLGTQDAVDALISRARSIGADGVIITDIMANRVRGTAIIKRDGQ